MFHSRLFMALKVKSITYHKSCFARLPIKNRQARIEIESSNQTRGIYIYILDFIIYHLELSHQLSVLDLILSKRWIKSFIYLL